MNKINIKQVDAFTSIPFGGNPAGVVIDASNISDEIKQRIAREMNVSESAFVSNSEVADFKVQFFTPNVEVDLCGHATVATFHSLYEEGKLDSSKEIFYQETKAGVLSVELKDIGDTKIFMMEQNLPKFEEIDISKEDIAKMLGTDADNVLDCPILKVNTGIPWLVFGLKSLDALKNISPKLSEIYKLSEDNDLVGITPFCLETIDENCDYHIRSIAPYVGVSEDPVCGTGNGCVSSYLIKNNLLDKEELIGEEGHFVNRPGRVYINIEKTNGEISLVKVGGNAYTILNGQIIY